MSDDNSLNGTAPLVEERAPTPAWRLDADAPLEAELAIRQARLAGLNRRNQEADDDE